MNILEKKIVVTQGRAKINLKPVEPHISDRSMKNGFRQDLWDKLLEEHHNDPHSMLCFPGDVFDDDRRSMRKRNEIMHLHRPETWSSNDEQHQRDLMRKIIPDLKAANKHGYGVLCMADGDHYKKYYNGLTSTQFICSQTGIPYLGERQGWCVLRFTRKKELLKSGVACYIIYIAHSYGGTASRSSDVRKMEKMSAVREADLYIYGHTHRSIPFEIDPVVYLDLHNKIEKLRRRYAVRCGSLMDTHRMGEQLYGEKYEYSPIAPAHPTIEIMYNRFQDHCKEYVEITTDARGGKIPQAYGTMN